MYANRVIENIEISRVQALDTSSDSVRSPTGFLFGDCQMKRIDISTPKHPNTFALVDNEDFEWLSQWKWCAWKGGNTRYVIRGISNRYIKKAIRMHRIILDAPDNLEVDHINHNGLDNRRCNLRICTRSEQQHNRCNQKNSTSGFKGVYYFKSKWMSRICYKGKRVYLGWFSNKIEAAKAYDRKALELFGEFALLNFPETGK